MKNKLITTLSLGLSSLIVALMIVAVTPTHNTTISVQSPTHGVSPLEDAPW